MTEVEKMRSSQLGLYQNVSWRNDTFYLEE